MVSKDDHPSKATPTTNTGVRTHPPATIATRRLLHPSSQSHESVWKKIKSGIQSDEVGSIYD